MDYVMSFPFILKDMVKKVNCGGCMEKFYLKSAWKQRKYRNEYTIHKKYTLKFQKKLSKLYKILEKPIKF